MKRVVGYLFLIVAVTCFLPIESAISQNLLVNGSFEASVSGVDLPTADATWYGNNNPSVDTPNSSVIDGWTINEIDWIFGLWNASEGSRSLDMNGFQVGYVEQTFNTTPGTSYIVTFDMAGHSLLPDLSLRAIAADDSADFGAVPNIDDGVKVYEAKSFEFTANSTSTTLRLASLNFSTAWPNRAVGPVLDNVVVEEIDLDNGAPDISNATVSPSEIWPPNNKMVDISIGGVTDPDGDAVTITVTAITDNEGSKSKDVVTGTSPQVRAKRNGKGNGRTYTIFFEAYDGTATVSGTVTVFVPHDKGKGKAGLSKGSTSAGLPRTFALAQNYPNPFNPTTTIRYELSQMTNVTLTIYNIQGQAVRDLVKNVVQGAGIYNSVWDGRDTFGKQVGSGIYYFRLEAGANVSIKKMTLIK